MKPGQTKAYSSRIHGDSTKRFSSGFRAALVALFALISAGILSTAHGPADVAGVYGGAGAGAALVVGARAIVLRNEKGAVLTLSGRQVGLIANADLSGLAISLGEVLV